MNAALTRCGEFRRPDDPAYGRTHGTPQTPFSWPWCDSRTEAHRDEAPTTTPHPLTFTARKRTGMLLLRNAGERAGIGRERELDGNARRRGRRLPCRRDGGPTPLFAMKGGQVRVFDGGARSLDRVSWGMVSPSSTTGANRGPNGQFLPNNRAAAGAGRRNSRAAKLRKHLNDVLTEVDESGDARLLRILRTHARQAEAGDAQSAAMLMKFALPTADAILRQRRDNESSAPLQLYVFQEADFDARRVRNLAARETATEPQSRSL